MKRIVYSVVLILISFTASFGQAIPNNGFENWTSMGSYNNPNQWSCLNDMSSPLGVYTCLKGTPGSVGTAYIKLISKNAIGVGCVPGVAVCGTIDQTTFLPNSGFPISGRPQSLTGKWQYMASGADQGFIAVALTHWDNTLGTRDTVATLYEALGGMAMSWATFTLPVNYLNGNDPDTCVIVLSASQANGATATANSYLYVDELAFSGVVAGIAPAPAPLGFDVSPNPATTKISVRVNDTKDKNATLKIINFQGEIVKTIEHLGTGMTTDVDIADLAKGSYIIQVKQNNKTISKNIIKQ